MADKVEFSLEKYKAQAKLPKVKVAKEKKLNFWQLTNQSTKKKRRPRFYKKQLFKVGKDLV